MIWNIWVIIVSVLLLVFLFWKETKRTNKQRLIWRLLACLVAISSLVFLAIPVSYKGKKSRVAQNEILLLTDGFSKDSLDKYRGSSSQKILIYTADETVFKREKLPDIRFIADLDAWQKTIPANATLHILGFGLAEAELQSLNQKPFFFTAPELPSGITKLNWIPHLKAGENFRVQGSFLNQTGDKIKLVLKGLNTGLGSVEIGAKRSMDFSFSTIPKQSGQAVFRLVALSGKDTIENEPIPIQIEPAKTIKVLMLSASPDFESRFLKNWLAENAYGVAARSTISKNKTTTAFANLNMLSLEKITPGLLQNFDVLITDATAFASLSTPETAAILAQTSANGMGLIFRADSSSNTSFIGKNFPLYQSEVMQKQLTLKLKDEANTHLTISADHPVFIRNQPETQILVQDEAAHLLVSSKLYGSGKMLLSTLNNTFNWQLSGNKIAYSTFWSMLLSKAAKKAGRKENVFTPILPDKNTMVQLNIETSNRAVSAKVNGTPILLSQNPAIPFLQEGFYWPDKTGWQTVSVNGMGTPSVYIFENTSWRILKAEKKIKSTRQYAQKFVALQQNLQNPQKEERVFIPSFWFYLLFLLSCTFLWFETKLL